MENSLTRVTHLGTEIQGSKLSITLDEQRQIPIISQDRSFGIRTAYLSGSNHEYQLAHHNESQSLRNQAIRH